MIRDTKKTITKKAKIGVLLLEQIKYDLKNNKELWLWLNPDNPIQPGFINIDIVCNDKRALQFYEKNGFINTENKNYEMKDSKGNILKFKSFHYILK